MAVIPKLFTRPRLQLLVLMLVLVAGLSPKSSIAQDDPATAPSADDTGTAPSDGSASAADKASGRAYRRPGKVKCYVAGKDGNHTLEKCLKAPDANTPVVEDCDYGCFQSFQKTTANGKITDLVVSRSCAIAAQVSCLEKKPGGCVNTGGDYVILEHCVQKHQAAEAERGTAKGRSGDGQEIEAYKACVCKRNLCNNETPSTGAKHLGYKVALVGALIVAGFPLLRSLFLVG